MWVKVCLTFQFGRIKDNMFKHSVLAVRPLEILLSIDPSYHRTIELGKSWTL